MNLNFVKLHRKIKYFRDLFQYMSMKILANCNANNQKVKVEKITLSNANNTDIVFLGNITNKSFFSNCSFFDSIYELTDKPSVIFYYSESEDADNKIFTYQDKVMRNTFSKEHLVLNINKISIGCAFFDLTLNKKIYQWKWEALKKQKILKRSKADFLIAYVKEGGEKKNLSKIKKMIGTWGFGIVIGIGKNIKGKRNFRTISFGETRIAYSLGRMNFEIKNAKREAMTEKLGVAYKVSLMHHSKKVRIMKEGYLPLLVTQNKNEFISVKEIKRTLINNEIERKGFLRLERLMRGLRNWRELIVLQDIFEVIEEKIPPKFDMLSGFSVNQICARTFELSPGNVFFFRKAFKDKNDLKVEHEFTRNKLILRALTRKSLFIFSYKTLPAWIPHIVIPNPMEAHIKVMAWYRKKFISAKYIGVTGSIGKTSTKDMLYYVFKEKYRTERNLRNSNVQVKIGINEQRISSDTEFYIQEIGGGRPGGASRHSRMVLPDVAIITNIGTAHIGNYESQEDLRDNKLGIIDGIRPGGMLFLNGDDKLLETSEHGCKTMYFAIKNHNADCYADNIYEIDGRTYFDIVHEGKIYKASINVLGEYNILNAVCAFSVAKYFGMQATDILTGLKKFKTSGIRQNIIQVGGYRFFVDCYNASADSIDNALSVLSKLIPKKEGKRIAIIGDVTGMGERQEEINNKIAEIVSSYRLDKIVCYGKNSYDICSRITLQNNYVIPIQERKKLESWMRANITKNDVTLFKGSSKVKLDETLDTVYGTNLADQRYIDEAHYSTFRKNKTMYKVFEDYSSLSRYYGGSDKFKIPNSILKKNVKKITVKAFYNNKTLKHVEVGKNVISIGSFAFAKCSELESVEFKGSIKFIGKGAFEGCVRLKRITFDEDLIHIAPRAFNACKGLKEIVIPKSIGFIGKNAFSGSKAKIKYI